jgi:UDP-N-acetylmuramyl pentapeptide phosphotransferase/UDP-N-acetylglucosamine-1-phosphate transferase
VRRALLGGLVSFGATYAAAPLVRRALVRRGALDIPNHRSSHTEPVPRGGGIACLIGVAAGIAATGRQSAIPPRTMLAVAALAATGLADDRLGHVSPITRLAIQGSAGLAMSPDLALAALSPVGTAGVVNVVNFMDGINGITGSTAAVWGASTLIAGRRQLDPTLQTLGAVTAGAGLGFIPWNAPKADLFLGDVGSYLFGGLCAAGITHAWGRGSRQGWLVAAPLLPYAVDASQALVRRAWRGAPLPEAHREHIYQRLVDEQGLSHVQSATLHALSAAVTSFSSRQPGWCGAVTTAAALALYISSPSWLRALRRRDAQ